jgi:aldose 1-epimerase
MHPSGTQYEIRFGDRRAVAVEVGGGLRAYDGVLLGYDAEEMAHAGRGQLLAPWPNRIEGGAYSFGGVDLQLPLSEPATQTAIHGLVRWANWTCALHEENAVALEHVLHPQPGYPFALRLRVAYSLDERGLTVETTAENVGADAAPFGAGHHPYFAGAPLVDDLEVTIDNETFVVGDRKLDETFHLAAPRVRVGEHVLWFEEPFRYVQLFTGDHPDVERRGLAVEPMTCPPNAFNTGEGLIVLEPGETFRGRWGIEDAARLSALPS